MSILNNIKFIYNKHRGIVAFFLLFIIVALFLLYMRDKGESWEILFNLTYKKIILLLIVSLLFKVILGYNFRVLIGFFKIRLSFKEWFGLSNLSVMTSYFLPIKGGMAVQAVYLKKVYKLRYTFFLNSVVTFYTLILFSNAIAGIVLSILVFGIGTFRGNSVLIFFISIAIASSLIFVITYYMPKARTRWRSLGNFFEGFKKFHKQPKRLLKVVFYGMMLMFAAMLRLWFAFWALGIEIEFIQVTMITLITSFSMFISITPGSLGIKEFFIIASGVALGIAPTHVAVAALLDRIVDILVTFILGAVFAYIFTRKGLSGLKDIPDSLAKYEN